MRRDKDLTSNNYSTCELVETKKGKLKIEIDVDLPLDIIENDHRREAVEEGLVRSISKGLYEEGVSFKINSVDFRIV
ncbi:MAG: hypothetical protein WBW34_02245 [Nitrososphaeraceae archaeon]